VIVCESSPPLANHLEGQGNGISGLSQRIIPIAQNITVIGWKKKGM